MVMLAVMQEIYSFLSNNILVIIGMRLWMEVRSIAENIHELTVRISYDLIKSRAHLASIGRRLGCKIPE